MRRPVPLVVVSSFPRTAGEPHMDEGRPRGERPARAPS
ncbi:hypothetical protein STXM2123_5997 [Streptomyces sp. F-3]|nr:hypothetical protein STXM2123_5997 [Streptomyces sp. F-3]